MRVFVIAMDCEAACLEGDHKVIVSGVGKVNAAAATQRAISEFGATEIVNIGVVGGFGPDVEVGGLYEVSSAVEYDFDLAKLNGTSVGVLNERDSAYIPMETTGRYPAKILMTGDRFNDDDADLDLIRELKGELRDMEGAAIAHVCERNGVKCRSLKCVTDVHGDVAMTEQYIANRERCLAILREAIPGWL